MAKITFNGKDRTTPFTWKGKQVVKLTLNGKVCTLTAAPTVPTDYPPGATVVGTKGGAYIGSWSTHLGVPHALEQGVETDFTKFRRVKHYNPTVTWFAAPWVTKIAGSVFGILHLTGVFLPNLVEAGSIAFKSALFTTIDSTLFPKLTTIGDGTFADCPATSVDLPLVTYIAVRAFQNCPLTNINLPNCDTILLESFESVVNAPTTTVTIKSKFNTPAEKDRIFGAGNWNQITFTWV